MNECANLINNYLCVNPKIYNNGFYAVSAETLSKIFLSLRPFDAPDMYAVIEGTTYAIEHFAIDASKESKKGMEGQREENLLAQRIANSQPTNNWHFEKVEYKQSLKNLQMNFEKHFNQHYYKLSSYRQNMIECDLISQSEQITFGFFIENLYPPLYTEKGRFKGELLYTHTKQFADFYKKCREIAFVLFGGYFGGKRQLFYIDQKGLPCEQELIDITHNDISLSHLNNELTMYAEFMEDTDV